MRSAHVKPGKQLGILIAAVALLAGLVVGTAVFAREGDAPGEGTAGDTGSQPAEGSEEAVEEYLDSVVHHMQHLQADFHSLGHFLLRPLSIDAEITSDAEWKAGVREYKETIRHHSEGLLARDPPSPEHEEGHEAIKVAATEFLEAMARLEKGLEENDRSALHEAGQAVAGGSALLDAATQDLPGFHHH